MKNKIKFSIKWKVFSFLALFTAIILLILWLTETVFLSDIYRSIKMQELQNSAAEISQTISSDDLSKTVKELARKNEYCIIVQDNNGMILAESEAMHNCVIHNISYRDRARLHLDAKENDGLLIERFKFNPKENVFQSVKDVETTSEENIIYTKCFVDNKDNEYAIFINSILTPVNATVKTLNTMLIWISISLLVIALVLSFIISYSISKPIKRLTRSAKLLADGDYDTFFPTNSSKEISNLANTLNYAASELKKNEALRRELIANISHDLRTPLTLIEGYGEVMKDIPNEMTSENLQIIIDESRRLSSLVNDVLDISKFGAGPVELNIEEFDLTEMIGQSMQRYQKLIEQEGYNIEFYPNRTYLVKADKQKILQVLYNLVNNAITHTGQDKKVSISQIVTQHFGRNYVRIEVTDTGDGIEADKLPLIWDRYYKVDKFHKRAQMGSGLGLSIVKSIIELHQGYYGVSSTLNVGSTFWFELPLL